MPIQPDRLFANRRELALRRAFEDFVATIRRDSGRPLYLPASLQSKPIGDEVLAMARALMLASASSVTRHNTPCIKLTPADAESLRRFLSKTETDPDLVLWHGQWWAAARVVGFADDPSSPEQLEVFRD